MANGATRKFFETTRGKIIQLLCGSARTVTELAEQLVVSENAVRTHLAALDREGLVCLTGKRPGTRKPHFSYELTPKAHQLFRKGYEPVLLELLEVLAQKQSSEELSDLVLEVGRRFVRTYLPNLEQQAPAARLKSLINKASNAGIPLSLARENGDVSLRGCSCPLTSVIERRPELCDVIARLLAEILNQPVSQHCDHGLSPRCEFRTDAGKLRPSKARK